MKTMVKDDDVMKMMVVMEATEVVEWIDEVHCNTFN